MRRFPARRLARRPDPRRRLARRVALALATTALAACADAPREEAAALSPGEHEVVLAGVRLWYRVAGEGAPGVPPVLYLHGGPGYNSHSFATLVGPELEPSLRMIYLDQRGSGRSERPWTGDYALATLVADVEALRVHLGVPRLSLVGHSFGGTLALEYAARHPEHVARMVLVAPASDAPATFAGWRRRLEATAPDALRRAEIAARREEGADTSDYGVVMRAMGEVGGKRFFDAMQFRDSTHRVLQDGVDGASGLRNTGELSAALFGNELRHYRFADAARLTMPVLVIGGRHDAAIGLETMRALAARLPRASLLEYEGSAHFPYLEERERFVRDVTAFLAEGAGEARQE